MSPNAGVVLLEEIAPRLRSAIPHVVKPVGAEDHEELIQDGITMAAQMLHALELRGKVVTPGNVAYYCILHLKSGRRSTGSGRTDALASSTQLDDKSTVLSLETEVGYDPELDEPIRLGEMLSCSKEDPSMSAGRNLDWEQFLDSHDHRYGVLVQGMAEGQSKEKMGRKCRLNYSRMRELKVKMASDLIDFMEDPIGDSVRVPMWRGNLLVDREKAACRADRVRG